MSLLGNTVSMESDSLETTVPTDLSISADDSELELLKEERKKKVTRQLYEKKQLQHDLQVLKIELSQKNLMLENLKADFMQKIEELEEKYGEVSHQKQILQVKLESQLNIHKEEARKRQEIIKKEVELILKKQQELEETNLKLQEKSGNIRKKLLDLDLTEKQYLNIKSQSEDDVSLRDYVAAKIFETVRPWRIESEDLKGRLKITTDELTRYRVQLESCQEDLAEEKRRHESAQQQLQKISLAYADTKTQVQHGDYKIENFDKIKRERDEFDQELSDVKKQLSYLEVAHNAMTRQRDELLNELGAAKQSITLLKQDKDFLGKQSSEFSSKLLYAEERIVQLNDQLDQAKQSREELYDKYVASRDSYKNEYESKLREELEGIRTRTNIEVDRLKASTREMYERENRSLREARDMALAERDRALTSEKDANNKHEQLLQEYRQLQMNSDNKLGEFQNEVRLKSFENERTLLIHEETVRNLKDCQLENEKLQKKLEVLTKEYYTMEASLEKRNTELEVLLKEKNIKLETYEKLEQELDNVVMQAAEIENETDAERVLFSYGYGANVPTTAKRRLTQSVHLARRVLQLERLNTSFKKEIEELKTRNKQLADEVKNANGMLDQTQQPYTYLIDSIRLRDQQVTKQKEHIQYLEDNVRHLEEERESLVKSKNTMAADLEKLLNQREEMSVMKQLIINLNQRRQKIMEYGDLPVNDKQSQVKVVASQSKVGANSKVSKAKVAQPSSHWEPAEPDHNVHNPPPTQFTSKSMKNSYKKLQRHDT